MIWTVFVLNKIWFLVKTDYFLLHACLICTHLVCRHVCRFIAPSGGKRVKVHFHRDYILHNTRFKQFVIKGTPYIILFKCPKSLTVALRFQQMLSTVLFIYLFIFGHRSITGGQ